MIKCITGIAVGILLTGCATARLEIPKDLAVEQALKETKAPKVDTAAEDIAAVKRSLASLPAMPIKPLKSVSKFTLAVKDLAASSVYQMIADEGDWNLIVGSDVKESITINLKNVTPMEALEALRDAYGLEYSFNGKRVSIGHAKLLNKVFQIDYIMGTRNGKSELKVSSGGVADSGSSGASGASSSAGATSGGQGGGRSQGDGSNVTTTIKSDFWLTLDAVLRSIVNGKEGQEVVINPQSGMVYVKAMPNQLRDVERYLEQTQVKVSRQVVLEAKIVEVVLSNGSQGGINWANFDPSGTHAYSIGANGAAMTPQGALAAGTTLSGANGLFNATGSIASGASALGFAFTGTSFSALMNFLQTNGDARVLSAPRVATLNNQKAVLKVGRDEFFVTNVTSTSTSNGTTTTNTPSINVQPFFSGIALDVTPQIDDSGYVTLHVHPSVSDVAEKSKVINLGGMGTYTLPLASSNINESDTMVRLLDGDIVAIGGLMSSTLTRDGQKVPLLGDLPVAGEFFKQHVDSYKKTEIVILIKPTVINKPSDWTSSTPYGTGVE